MTILYLVILAIIVEAVTEILVASDLLERPRNWLKSKIFQQPPAPFLRFWGRVISCGYCTSVWVAMLFALLSPLNITSQLNFPLIPVWLILWIKLIIDWVVSVFLLHRLSNWLHVCYSLLKNGRVGFVDIRLDEAQFTTITEALNGRIGPGTGTAEPEIKS